MECIYYESMLKNILPNEQIQIKNTIIRNIHIVKHITIHTSSKYRWTGHNMRDVIEKERLLKKKKHCN